MTSSAGVRVLAACCFFVVLAASATVAEGKSYSNIIAYLRKEPKFSIIYSYIKKAGIEKALSSGRLEVTLFLPSNKVFKRSVKQQFDNFSDTRLEEIILSHAVSGAWATSCLKTGVTLETLRIGYGEAPQTLLVDSLAVPGKIIVRAVWSSARVVGGNVRAGKALVHEIDNPLLFEKPYGPRDYDSIDEAVAALNLTRFAAMVANYKPTPGRLDVAELYGGSEIPGTVFAWTDAVWQKTVDYCENSNFNGDLIVAYSFTFELLPLSRMASNYQYKTLYLDEEERTVTSPREGRITYVKGLKYPSILVDRRDRTLNITKTIYTMTAVLHLLDGIPFPNDRDGLCGY